MRYSTDVKRTALEKLLRPGGPGVSALSAEFGISETTLYKWLHAARNGGMSGNAKRRGSLGLNEKLAMVLEARGLRESELGRWLREKGLHEAQLARWAEEIDAVLASADGRGAREAELDRELKAARKELARKDKALAELSALIVLKKKLAGILGDEEPPT